MTANRQMSREPILVTGAAGRLGGVGGAVVELLRQRDLPVRALVRTVAALCLFEDRRGGRLEHGQ